MKTQFRILTTLFALAVISAGCVREHTGFGEPGDGTVTSGKMGYIDLGSGLSITVHAEDEEIDNPSDSDNTTRATRAAGDTDDFTVEIIDTKTSAIAKSFKYGERSDMPIELPVGNYYINVYSGTMKDVAWEGEVNQPTYGAVTDPFDILATHDESNPRQIDPIVCSLQSVKISVTLEKGMAAVCDENTTIDVILADKNSVTYDNDYNNSEGLHFYGVVELDQNKESVVSTERPSKNSYLRPEEKENKLSAVLHTTIDGVKIDKTIPIADDAKAGEWRKISLYIISDSDEKGQIVIGATIEKWVYNELITVDATKSTAWTEEQIPDIDDPDAPIILPENGGLLFHDMNKITASDYTINGDYNKPAQITVETTSAITRFAVRMSTDNREFENILNNFGMNNTSIDLMTNNSNAYTQLNLWGFPRRQELADSRSLTIDLKSLMSYFHNYPGTHQVIIAVTDAEGHYSRVDIDLNIDLSTGGGEVDPSDGPSIVWVGYDIKQKHRIAETESCEIHVTAPAGIAKFMVNISGRIVDLELLADVNIPESFDLCDPDKYTPESADQELSVTLKELGFPVGNEVKGVTALVNGEFNITTFLNVIQGVAGGGESDFSLSVTDKDGKTSTEIIQLIAD